MNIAVIFGGISLERNVSISGGLSVVEALRSKGHNVLAVDPAYGVNALLNGTEITVPSEPPTLEELSKFPLKNIIDCINSEIFDQVDVAFIVLHGKYGEDGRIQSLLELRGIPYTGSGVKASAVAIDKITSKLLFASAGIPTPNWTIIHDEDLGNYDLYESLRMDIGSKLAIKPANQGSSIGISFVLNGNLDDIHHAVEEAAKYGSRIIVEEYIEGRELTVGIVGEEVLPVIEIIPESGIYDYSHKYKKGMTEYICPAEIDDNMEEYIQTSAHTAYRILGCTGFGRVDFRLDEEGGLYCLEVNTIPGFTSTSLVPKAAAVSGIEFPELCEMIIDFSLKS